MSGYVRNDRNRWDGVVRGLLIREPSFFPPKSSQTADEPNFVKIKLSLVALADLSKTDTYNIKLG